MPIYDFECARCRSIGERLVPMTVLHIHCACGGIAQKVWSGRGPTMVPDSIPGGVLLENLTAQPKRFYSRTEIKDEMRAKGVEQHVKHVGEQGSDKSKRTQRFV